MNKPRPRIRDPDQIKAEAGPEHVGSGVRVVAHPQAPQAHSAFLPMSFQGPLAGGFCGEGVQMGAHLWAEREPVSRKWDAPRSP